MICMTYTLTVSTYKITCTHGMPCSLVRKSKKLGKHTRDWLDEPWYICGIEIMVCKHAQDTLTKQFVFLKPAWG